MGSLNSFKRTGTLTLKLILCMIFVLCMVPVLGLTATAKADGGLQISTTYPGTTVKAGTNTTFSIKVANSTGSAQDIALSYSGLPDEWTAFYTGGSATITRVFVDNAASGNVTFNLNIPADAAEKVYTINLTAKANGGAVSTFPLELNVSKKDISLGKFTAQFSSLSGSNTTTFKFSTTIANDTTTDQTYSLSANVPSGWTAAFAPSYQTQQIASISVTAGSSQGIDVSITPAASAPAGNSKITCTAVSAQANMSLDLEVQITGSYKLTIATQSNVLSGSATAGSETAIPLTLSNAGSVDLNNINLTATAPQNWSVSFDMPTVDKIAAGATQTVTAKVKPAANAIVGDYNITFTAGNDAASSNITYRTSIQTSTTWFIIAAVVILALVVGLTILFSKLGRR